MSANNPTYGFPITMGFFGGICAFLIGAISTILYLMSTANGWLEQVSGDASNLVYAGLVFYESQLVVIQDQPIVSTAPESVSVILVYLIPVLVLMLFGLFVGWVYYAPFKSNTDGGIAGMSLCIGYVFASFAGRYVFRDQSGFLDVAPPITESIVLIGVVYPVVIGGFAGILGFWLRKQVSQ